MGAAVHTESAPPPRYSTVKVRKGDYDEISTKAGQFNASRTEVFSALRLMMDELPDQFLNALRRVRESDHRTAAAPDAPRQAYPSTA